MKKILFILISLSFYNTIYSQKFRTMMKDRNVNIYDVVNEAENYFKTHDKNKKGSGWKPYQRWLYENESKYYPSGNRKNTDPNLGVKSFLKFKNNNVASRNTTTTNNWQELGPFKIDTVCYKPSVGIGRVIDFYVDPNDTNYMYISSRSGGIFKTTDGGVNWEPKTDYLFSTGVNNFGVSPTDRNELLISVNNSGNEYSNGIYKSTDGGDTWTTTAINPLDINLGLGYDFRVRKVKYHPQNDNIVFVCANDGLYRSTDKLTTYTKILDNVDVIDIAFHPTNANIIYVYEKTTEINKIYISNDQGLTFTLSNEIVGNNNAKNGQFSTSPACPDCVYFSSQNGIFKSSNNGLDFTFLSNPVQGNGGFAVSDLDNTLMLRGYINIGRSTDDGQTFTAVTASSVSSSNATDTSNSYTQFMTSTNYVHVDLHPTKCINGVFYIGTDGWFCKSENNGDDWTLLNQNVQTGTAMRENYRLGVSQSNSNRFITGCQDNGTAIKREEHWVDFVAGDGGVGLFHPLNYNWAIGSSQYAIRNRTENGGYSKVQNFRAGSEEGSFVAPIVIDPNNQMTLYDFKLGVWKSEDFGDTWVQKAANVFTGVIKQAVIAENNSNIIIISRNAKIKKSTDGGSTFVDIQNGLPNSSIRGLYIDPNNDDRIFVLYNSYENNGEKIFMSENGGTSWQNITSNLGDMPLRTMVIDDDQNIYVGSEIGVYTKPITGTTWTLYNTNLPNISINDLKIVTGTNTLRAATFGRGSWECKLIGKENYPAIVKTEITDLPTKTTPKEGLDQYVYSEIEYAGTLSNVEVRWSLNSVDFNNVIPMSSIGGNQWKSNTPLPNEVAGTKIYFKVFATGSNNDTSKTYKFMYTVKDAVYCNAIGNTNNNASTTLVNFNTINNASTKTNGYEDFTSISTTVTKGMPYDMTVNVNTDGNVRYKTAVWIDWNHNYEFEASERYYLGKIKNKNDRPTSLSPLSITIPNNIDPTTTRMRVITKGGAEPVDPCREGANGEVEDYTIIVENSTAAVTDEVLSKIKFYPNPTDSKLTLDFGEILNTIDIEIINVIGQTISKQLFKNRQKIDLNLNLSKGIYYIKVTENNTGSKTVKIIKK